MAKGKGGKGKAKAKTQKVKVGDALVFKSYTDLAADQKPIFSEGENLTVVSVADDGTVVAQNVDAVQDTVFYPEEVDLAKGKAKTKSTVKKVKVAKVVEVMVIVDTPAVIKLLKKHGAIAAAETLVEQSEQTFFLMGGVLAHIHQEKSYESLGYEGKDGYAEYTEKHLGVNYRKAKYLESIYTYFTGLGMDETRLAAIGWSKAKDLVGVATEENLDEMLDYAEKHSRNELLEFVQATKVKAGTAKESKMDKVKYGFTVFADQSEVVAQAIQTAQTQIGSDNVNDAILHILQEWAMLGADAQTTLDQDMAFLESKHGVVLSVADGVEVEQTPANSGTDAGEAVTAG